MNYIEKGINMTKRIMIVAGGEWQVPLVKKAKEENLFVINSNLYENSPAFEFADVSVICNVLDYETNLLSGKEYKPDGIITDQSDIAVSTVARLCQSLGLKGIGNEKASLFTNKFKMREFGKKNGFPTPDFELCTKPEQVEAFVKKHHLAVMKPIDSQSSRGIYWVTQDSPIRELFSETMEFSNSAHEVLVEEHIGGTEFTVDGIMDSGGYHTLSISEKKHFEDKPGVASELYFSHFNEKFDYNQLREVNKDVVEKMGLPFGLTHAEYKYYNGKYYLIEIAARGGGTKISSHINKYMSGLDSNKALIRMALGEEVSLSEPKYDNKCAILKFFEFEKGTVEKIYGVEEISNIPGVLDFGLSFTIGDTISNIKDDRSRPAYLIACADSAESLDHIVKKVGTLLKIEYQKE